MNRRDLLMLGAAIVGGAAIGWATASAPRVSAPAEAALQVAVEPRHGGVMAGAAAQRLTQLSFVTPPTPEPVPETPPPPPDVAVVFRRELSAIEQTPNGLVAWIVDPNQPNGRRALRRGDVYRDGWRMSAISAQTIELRKQQARRRIDLFAPIEEVSP